MTPLPYDFARCITDNCPLAHRCRRKTPGRPGYQSLIAFKGGACCEGFIDGGEDARNA